MRKLQRLRRDPILRNLTATTEFHSDQLIQPHFAVEGLKAPEPVPGLKGVHRLGIAGLLKAVERDLEAGVRSFLLFGVPEIRFDSAPRFDYTARAIQEIKKQFKSDLCLWVDTCLCSVTSHGHCCLFHKEGSHSQLQPDCEATLKALAQAAVDYANAGADGISPSDMMDGRVLRMREALDEAGHSMIPIMSYSTKFASQFYGPFRVAADSAPEFGDRRFYQIDVRNRDDALRASQRCAEEGADLLMVKPGLTSIDLIQPIHQATGLPVGAYQTSGEFGGLTLLESQGLIHFEKALLETWQVMKRAGAQYIITYGARYGKLLKSAF